MNEKEYVIYFKVIEQGKATYYGFDQDWIPHGGGVKIEKNEIPANAVIVQYKI